jgi:hypothetical protein
MPFAGTCIVETSALVNRGDLAIVSSSSPHLHSAPSFVQEYLSHVLLPHGLIVDRVEKIAADILADYPTSTPHLLVVLKVRRERFFFI